MVTTEQFKPPETSVAIPVNIGDETVIKVNAKGVIHVDGNVHCNGETFKVGNQIVDQVLELTQYKVTLVEERFRIKDGKVEAARSHVKMPDRCNADRGCETAADGTYVWDPEVPQCELEYVRDVMLEQEGPYHVDHANKLMFELGAEHEAPAGCPSGVVYPTDFEDLYLTIAQTSGYIKIFSQDIDLALYTDTRLNYLEYNLEKARANLQDSIQSQMCQNLYGSEQGVIKRLYDGRFGMRTGDAMLVFDCPARTSAIASPTGGCFDKVKTADGLYVDVVSRIAYKHATPVSCNSHFPIMIETVSEGWVTVSDAIRPVDPPEVRKIAQREIHHESFGGKGLYTEEELKAWEQLASWGVFHDAVMGRISTGVCRGEDGPCSTVIGQASGGYTLDRLAAVAKDLDPMETYSAWVRENAGYLSLIVLIVYGFQILVVSTMISWATYQDGFGAGLAMCMVAFCTVPHLMERGRRRRLQYEVTDSQCDPDGSPGEDVPLERQTAV